MDQLYTTSQVSNITGKNNFITLADMFPRINNKVKKQKMKTT